MASKLKPDYSLERDGRSLAEWLWLLVDERSENRIKAGDALESMVVGVPTYRTDWFDLEEFPDTTAQEKRFTDGLRKTLAQQDFDTHSFVENSVLTGLPKIRWRKQSKNPRRISNVHDHKFDRLAKKLTESINSADDAKEKSRSKDRLARLVEVYVCGSVKANEPFANAESVSSAGMAAFRMFKMLSHEFLKAPNSFEELLNSNQRYDALDVITRIGPPAVSFAPLLLEDLDNTVCSSTFRRFDAAHALGSISRDHAGIINELVDRLKNGDERLRYPIAGAFEHIGPHACGREREICDIFLAMLDQEDGYEVIRGLAAVGPDFPDVRKRIVELASPRPPRWIHSEYGRSDGIMYERAAAIDAMAYLIAYPAECIPVLIDAIDSFEEFDPDQTYNGAVERVATVLGEFGESATGAVTSLLNHLADEGQDFPKSILDALARIGAGATHAIPHLYEFRKTDVDEPINNIDTDVIDKTADQVGWTIQQIVKASKA